jgi:hypothetical protein
MKEKLYTEDDVKQVSQLIENIIKRHTERVESLIEIIQEKDKKIEQYERLLKLVKMSIKNKSLDEELCEEIREEKLQ